MLPPKKNQAAREKHIDTDEEEEKEKVENDQAGKTETSQSGDQGSSPKKRFLGYTDVDSDDEDFKRNVFEETVLQGKRKHFVNRHEECLNKWISDNFVEKEGKRCALSMCYSAYLALCSEENLTNALEEYQFNKTLKKEFPKGFGLSEDSKYKDDIREYKKTEKTEGGVKADTLKLKLKDVVNQAFEGLNNPKEGIMFNTLKKYMIGKFPALQLAERPKVLLRGLQNGVFHGYVELLRGVGKAGKYRWYDPERHVEEKKSKKKDKGKEDEKSDGEKKEGTESEETAESAEEGAKDENNEEGKDDEKKEETKDKKASPKKKKPATKKKGNPKPKKRSRKFIVHSDPQTIDETFPLALTFMAEPKEASGKKCLNYVEKYYDVTVTQDKFSKVLEKGEEKGYWTVARGAGLNSVYQLTVESFDPTDDDDMIGKIINAIMAHTEPKSCSARALKEYLIEFHPDYKIADKPYLYKRALERATNKKLLRQVSGIGCTGTFELVESFIPSPSILGGKDTSEDYEESDAADDESSEDEGITDSHEVDMSLFQDAYKPRPSKRRGKSREVSKAGAFDKNAAYAEALRKQQQLAAKRKSGSGNKRSKSHSKSSLKVPKKRSRQESSDEEKDSSSSEEEEEDDAKSDAKSEVDSTYGSDNAEKYRPRASQSRGGPSRGRAPPPTKASRKMPPPPKKARGKKARSPSPPPAKVAKGKKAATQAKKTPQKATPASKAKASPAKGKATSAKATPSRKRRR